MQLSINRELLLNAIDLVERAADKRHNLVVLSNIKLELTPQLLTLTASDLEVELMAQLSLPEGACIEAGATTLPAGKLKDICKSLPADMAVSLDARQGERCVISCAESRFVLGTLPATDFPTLGDPANITPLSISRSVLFDLLTKTQFAMAIQDVRYYLTGMLFEVAQRQLTTVATDGHRLALARSVLAEASDDLEMQVILPNKTVSEMQRTLAKFEKLLVDTGKRNKWNWNPVPDGNIELKVGRDLFRMSLPFGNVDQSGTVDDTVVLTITSQLVEGKFPDYRRVMPSNTDKRALLNRDKMTDMLRRVSILSNEKSRSVIFEFNDSGSFKVRAHNAEQDEAAEVIQGKYAGDPIEVSFNAAYLLDVLDVLQGDVELHMSHANSSVLMNQLNDTQHQYVIMPMRI